MKGLLRKQPDGTVAADLVDKWGYRYTLIGTKTDGGFAIEVRLTGIPEELWVHGDEAWFDEVKK